MGKILLVKYRHYGENFTGKILTLLVKYRHEADDFAGKIYFTSKLFALVSAFVKAKNLLRSMGASYLMQCIITETIK